MPRASGAALGRIIVQRCVFSGNGPSVMVFGSAGAGVCASRAGLFLWRMGSFKAKPWPEPTPLPKIEIPPQQASGGCGSACNDADACTGRDPLAGERVLPVNGALKTVRSIAPGRRG